MGPPRRAGQRSSLTLPVAWLLTESQAFNFTQSAVELEIGTLVLTHFLLSPNLCSSPRAVSCFLPFDHLTPYRSAKSH